MWLICFWHFRKRMSDTPEDSPKAKSARADITEVKTELSNLFK